jgi:hypothetical protein
MQSLGWHLRVCLGGATVLSCSGADQIMTKGAKFALYFGTKFFAFAISVKLKAKLLIISVYLNG